MFDRQERTQHNEKRHAHLQQHRHCRGLRGLNAHGHRGPNGAHPHSLALEAREREDYAASGRGRRCRHGLHSHNENVARPNADENTCPLCGRGCSLDAPECRKGASLAEERRS